MGRAVVDADWATAQTLRVVANNLFGRQRSGMSPNVYRSHAQSGEGFHQAPSHQKKCNKPYFEPVRVEAAWNQGSAFRD
jgi:hypothetical protein